MKLRNCLAIGLLGLAPIQTIQAESGGFAYKGFPLGSDFNKFRKSNPEFICRGIEGSQKLHSCYSDSSSYYKIKAKKIYVQFLDGKIINVDIELEFAKSEIDDHEFLAHTAFTEIKEVMISRYGNPSTMSDFSSNLQEKGMSASWEKSDSQLFLVARDSALATFTDKNWKTKIGKGITISINFGTIGASAIWHEVYKKDRKKDL